MDRYYENREEEIKYRKQNYEVNRDFVRDLKRKPCTDCGGSFHFSAMDFDHTEDDKRKDVSKILKGSRDTLLAEIAKCELVCANCHRVRTWQRTQK